MVGPHMPWPMMNIPLSLPKAPSSCCQITFSIGVAPRPPYSFGQCRQAQPPSAFFFCQALPTSTISSFSRRMRPSEDFESSASYFFGALASIHLRAVARNSASCGVSSKFMADLSFFLSCTNLKPHGEEARQRRLEPCGPWPILRDATLRAAPQDEVGILYARPLVGILL